MRQNALARVPSVSSVPSIPSASAGPAVPALSAVPAWRLSSARRAVHELRGGWGAVALAAVSMAAYAAWLLSDVGTARTRMAVSDAIFVIAPLIATRSCWVAHRVSRARHSAWAWLAAGCLTWATASLVWAVYELVLGQTAPFPSWADLGYVGYAIPVAVGVSRFPRSPASVWSRWRLVLDSVVIGCALLLTSEIWVLSPIADATTMTFSRLDAFAYPLVDVTVASIVLTRCMVTPDARRRVWIPLSVGLLVLALTDSLYVAQTFARHFRPGSVVDLGWLVSFLLVAIAARASESDVEHRPRRTTEDPPTMLRQLLPYAAIALAAVAVVSGSKEVDSHGRYWWLTLPFVACVVVRQLVVVVDHTTLTRDLAHAVDRRTSQLTHREQWWRDVVQNLSDVVMVLDRQGTVAYCSPSVTATLGERVQRFRRGAELRSQIHPDDLDKVQTALGPVIAGEQRNAFVECRVRRPHGDWGSFEVTAVGSLSGRALEGTVLTLHDVSDRRQLLDRLTHQAFHDALTGLPNRARLVQRLEEALTTDRPEPFALLLVDLDDFKVINDLHGHTAGDLVLQVIGRRLDTLSRAGDTIARLGGDEFALLLKGDAEQVRATAVRLTEEVARPVQVRGRSFLVRASVGGVLAAKTEPENAHTMLSHADIALYEAKGRERGGIVLIGGPERAAAARQVHLREQIAQPRLEQFSVVYQPLVDLGCGRITGVESLMRWNHPELGSVSPEDFIPMSEHGGSIQQLGWFVLTEACAQLVRWQREAPHHRLVMGVNVSIRQLDEPHFAARVLELVLAHGIDPAQIVLELTEESLAVDFETAVVVVAELRAGGLSVAVDDFGTGYSSLRYLHRFAADVVKIDKSFVANLEGSTHTQKIVRSVIDMAQALDLQSIAEGIETPAQLELVRGLGCELGQGYLFSRPVPPDRISAMLAPGAAPLLPPGPRRTAYAASRRPSRE